ncbi:MAG: MATE family efflux transporter [Clostridia bacterium]|nr:MATE family efflux transporter [Clostridia bacterium]
MNATISNPGAGWRSQLAIVWKLSIPAILTQLTSMVMQYIDSAMVGHLGANASASIGLVVTSTWLINGIGFAIMAGFSVQVAQYIGAGEPHNARRVVKHGLVACLIVSIVTMVIGVLIAKPLPRWLGGEEVLWADASAYFLVYSLTIPALNFHRLASSYMQSAGNMVTPSILNGLTCVADAFFNILLIPKYGVLGAALGTAIATIVVCIPIMWICCFRYEPLRINRKEACPLDVGILKRASKIGIPVGLEEMIMSSAYVAATAIIAPLGSIAIAAHSFAVTAESLCYMPGYGIAMAATTLVGQSIGAGNYKLARRYGYLTTAFGSAFMTVNAVIMFFACPLVFIILTPVKTVQVVATEILRIGLLAEPFYGASIVASGALKGAEDTLVPSLMALLSMWAVRLGLAMVLVPIFGVRGMWIAMAIELCFRGIIFLARLFTSKYMKAPEV